MIKPADLDTERPMTLQDGVVSTTSSVWEILHASFTGDLDRVRKLAGGCPELIYAQYNYTPPIHFAVREGHLRLVEFLLAQGAHDPGYRIYPFRDSLQIIAADRGLSAIEDLLNAYAARASDLRYRGDNGAIDFRRTALEQEFEDAIHRNNYDRTAAILETNPEFAKDNSFFWGEGILMKAIQHREFGLAKLLLDHGATFPKILKWIPAYYFKFDESAEFSLRHGFDPNSMSWQRVTVLHDMAQRGFLARAALLLDYGAQIDPVDDEYRSTPLGMASRWGRLEMVEFLLERGADPNASGSEWATPLEWAKKKGHPEIAARLKQHGAIR